MHDATVLIAGASSGLGKVTAVKLADEGYRVFAGMRELRGRNAGVARELASAGITAVEIDVTSDASVSSAVQRVLDDAGGIDVLVNSAGVMWLGNTEAFSVAQFEALLQTNLVGALRLFKAVLPGMRERGDGLLMTITSIAGRTAPPSFGIYAASKNGLEALAEVLGYEVSGLGIDSVIVEPGPFPGTNLGASQRDPEDQEIVRAYGELGRFRERVGEAMAPIAAADRGAMQSDLVAEHILELIRMPKGRRPVRTTVGLDFGLQQLNDAAQHHQRKFLDMLGLGAFERVAAQRVAP
jgi:NAD(P)-dependent dehydrogenase (short-subunit alcohol dehydrogenase family)